MLTYVLSLAFFNALYVRFPAGWGAIKPLDQFTTIDKR
jgi:hypothetical protein